MHQYALAIDIGASSGRHVVGWVENGQVKTKEIYRFPNAITRMNDHDCWDPDKLFFHILEGMKKCAEEGYQPHTVAIDTWGVDYVLLDKEGKRISHAVSYRDRRTDGMPERLEQRLPFDDHYRKTGIAKQPYNTVYQLMAQLIEDPLAVQQAAHLLFLPCYFSYRLCGIMKNEYTISSTNGLLNATSRDWDLDILSAIGISPKMLCGTPVPPGTALGNLLPEVRNAIGYDCQVILTASHDTASAFFAVPEIGAQTAFLSSGTWSLLGARLEKPILNQSAMQTGFTNEGGVNGIRFLKNIMGLWILQEIRREWHERLTFGEIADLAASAAHYRPIFDVTDVRFLHPDSMEAEIRQVLADQGAPSPSEAELLFCVHRSLAVSYRNAVKNMEQILNQKFTSMVILGGGNQNQLLNKLTEETGLNVLIGPTEGSALGNIQVQLFHFTGNQ